MEITLIIVSLTAFIFVANQFLAIRKLGQIADELVETRQALRQTLGEEYPVDEEGMEEVAETDSEESVGRSEESLRREKEFEERIARIKDELAREQPIVTRESSVAEILNPNVYNIPHEEINTKQTNPPEEYAK